MDMHRTQNDQDNLEEQIWRTYSDFMTKQVIIQNGLGLRVGKQINGTEQRNETQITGYLCGKKRNWSLYLTPYANINLRWIIDLSMKAKTIKLLEDRKKIFMTFEVGKDF